MVDIAFKQNEALDFTVLINGPDLQTDDGLRTAIIISLFTDRLVGEDEAIPDGTNNRRGWWADAFAQPAGDLMGSRLWLLNREKQVDEVLERSREYAEESLQWLLTDNVASKIEVETEWVKRSTVGILIRVFKANAEPFEQTFEYSLEAF